MRLTELLQEIRKMRFEEAYGVWTGSRLSQERWGQTRIDARPHRLKSYK